MSKICNHNYGMVLSILSSWQDNFDELTEEMIFFFVTSQLNNSFRSFFVIVGQNSEFVIVSENSCSDDKFHFVLETSRRSNMTCLQLYTKEIEASPGESAALSLCSRHVSSQGFPSISNETQVCFFVYGFEVVWVV